MYISKNKSSREDISLEGGHLVEYKGEWLEPEEKEKQMASLQQLSGGADKGKVKYLTCLACHGVKGRGLSTVFPALAGKSFNTLVKALTDIRSGKRKHSMVEPLLAGLTDEDIKNVSRYISEEL